MLYIPTQQDLYIIHQNKMNLYIIIEVMDTTLKPIASLQGELISDNFTIDAESDIRRTFHLTLYVKDSSFIVSPDSKIWINKFIRIQIGLKDQRTAEIVYYNMGTYLFDEAGYQYDVTTNTLTLTCVDLMANFTGLRNGQVLGTSTIINEGSDIWDAIHSTIINLGKLDEYQYRIDARMVTVYDENGQPVGQEPSKVPHDLKFPAETTVYDILTKINEIEAGWEMFFDLDDRFVNQKIPTTLGDPCVLDWETLEDLIISESLNTKFSEVKNCTRIWGKCLEPDRSIAETSGDGTVYEGVLDYLIVDDGDNDPSNDDILSGTTISLVANVTNLANPKIQIRDRKTNPHIDGNGNVTYTEFIKTYDIVEEIGYTIKPLPAGRMLQDKLYVLKYKKKTGESIGKFYLQGEPQIIYIVKEYNELPLAQGQTEEQWIAQDKQAENTDNIKYIIHSKDVPANATPEEREEAYSPFAIDTIGEIRQVLADGEYNNIYTDDLARQRAEYENWKAMRLNYELNLRMKPVLWLDVNQKIQYKSKITGNIEEYIIKSIEGSSMSGEINVKAIKFYPLYPTIVSD